MWVFVERHGVRSALSRVTAAALCSHHRCEERLREQPESADPLVSIAGPETPNLPSMLDTEVGRLEAYWHLVLRGSDVRQWRLASARCRRLRRLLAPLTGQAGAGAARVLGDAERTRHPKRARAVRRAARLSARRMELPGTPRSRKRSTEVLALLGRDADAWRIRVEESPGDDQTRIQRSLLRAVVQARKRCAGCATAGIQQTLARPAQLLRGLRAAQRLAWQLELIAADGPEHLGPLLADMQEVRESLAQRQAVAVFAAQLDKLPLDNSARRRLEKAVEQTWTRLCPNPAGRVNWPLDELTRRLQQDLRGWVWRYPTEESVSTGEEVP